MATYTGLPGHFLLHEGAAFEIDVKAGVVRFVEAMGVLNSSAGVGVGICSCGESSEVLPSGKARQRWHAAHKDEIRAQAAA